MINKLKNWLKKENEEADKRLDAFFMSLFDETIRKPMLSYMVSLSKNKT